MTSRERGNMTRRSTARTGGAGVNPAKAKMTQRSKQSERKPAPQPAGKAIGKRKQQTIEKKIRYSKSKNFTAKVEQFKKRFFWQTADLYRDDPVDYVIFSIRDFIFFTSFLLLTGLIAFGDLDYTHNYYGNVVTEVLIHSKFVTYSGGVKTFNRIHAIPEIWAYMKSVPPKVLHNAFYGDYEGRKGSKVLTGSVILGTARVRQKRVKSGNCTTAKLFEDIYRTCFDYYSDIMEDKSDFGGGPTTASSWNYSQPLEHETTYYGTAASYGGGGFVFNFSTNTNQTIASLQELEDNNWIRAGVRAVFVDFTLYAPSANLFCIVKLIFEIIPAGGVVNDFQITTANLWHESAWDWFIFGCRLTFKLYTVYFTVEEFAQIVILKESYFDNWWNLLDVIVVILCWCVDVSSVILYTHVRKMRPKILAVHEFSSFDETTAALHTYKIMTATLIFFIWLKLSKFALLIKSTALLLSTIVASSTQIVVWSVGMIAMLTGFAILGRTLLDDVLQFRSVRDSFVTLSGLFIGGFYFYDEVKIDIEDGDKVFFAVFIVLVSVIMFATYTAIIVNGFQKAVFELEDARTIVYFGDVFQMLFYRFFHFWLKKDAMSRRFNTKLAHQLVKRNYEELLEIMRRRGCRGMELALLLKKHNARPGSILSFETMSEVYDDFLARCQLALEVEGHTEILDMLEKINTTIDFLDVSLGDVWIKMDTYANKLALQQAEKRKTMEKSFKKF